MLAGCCGYHFVSFGTAELAFAFVWAELLVSGIELDDVSVQAWVVACDTVLAFVFV